MRPENRMALKNKNTRWLRCGNTSNNIAQLGRHIVADFRVILLGLPQYHNLARNRIGLLQIAKICCTLSFCNKVARITISAATGHLARTPNSPPFFVLCCCNKSTNQEAGVNSLQLQIVAKETLLRAMLWWGGKSVYYVYNLQRNSVAWPVGLFSCSCYVTFTLHSSERMCDGSQCCNVTYKKIFKNLSRNNPLVQSLIQKCDCLTKYVILSNIILSLRDPVWADHKKCLAGFLSWVKETLFINITIVFWKPWHLALQASRY